MKKKKSSTEKEVIAIKKKLGITIALMEDYQKLYTVLAKEIELLAKLMLAKEQYGQLSPEDMKKLKKVAGEEDG